MKSDVTVTFTDEEFAKLYEVMANELSDAISRHDNPYHISAVEDLKRKLFEIGMNS